MSPQKETLLPTVSVLAVILYNLASYVSHTLFMLLNQLTDIGK